MCIHKYTLSFEGEGLPKQTIIMNRRHHYVHLIKIY